MKCGARVALGVAGGYFLGRTKKMKLALMLGGMAAGRQAGGPRELLEMGSKLLGQSPELSKLTDEVRGRLLQAGKGAALAVAARQVEALTDRVGKRVESLGDVGGALGKSRGEADEEPADEYDEPAGDDEAASDEDAESASDEPRDEPEEEQEEEAPPPRRASRQATKTTKATGGRAGKTAAATGKRVSGTAASATSGGRRATSKAGAGGKGTRSPRTRRSSNDG
jgi:hypothetical protein